MHSNVSVRIALFYKCYTIANSSSRYNIRSKNNTYVRTISQCKSLRSYIDILLTFCWYKRLRFDKQLLGNDTLLKGSKCVYDNIIMIYQYYISAVNYADSQCGTGNAMQT